MYIVYYYQPDSAFTKTQDNIISAEFGVQC